jgi:hypothetical protein
MIIASNEHWTRLSDHVGGFQYFANLIVPSVTGSWISDRKLEQNKRANQLRYEGVLLYRKTASFGNRSILIEHGTQ